MSESTAKSPFPGMDPYLEEFWHDVHIKLVGLARTALNEVLPEDLVARADTHAESEPGEDRQHRIRIANGLDGLLIAVIVFVGPGNKSGSGLTAYRRERADLLSQGAHVVEIDLVRQGDWRAMLTPLPFEFCTPYRIITRFSGSPEMYAYPIDYDQALPRFHVPLRPGDPEVLLALQPLLDEAYRGGRYGKMLRDDGALYPAPMPDEAAVIRRLLIAGGRLPADA